MSKNTGKVLAVFGLMAIMLLVTVAATYWAGTRVIVANEEISGDELAVQTLDDTLSTLRDAETGQRGYLLTNNTIYLDPYNSALAQAQSDLDNLNRAVADGKLPAAPVATIKSLATTKFQELAHTLELAKSGQRDAALEVVRSNAGIETMNSLRREIGALKLTEQSRLDDNRQQNDSYTHLRSGAYVGCAVINLIFMLWAYRRVVAEMDRARAAANSIREQREFYATTLASIGDAVITTDSAGLITFMNQIAVDLTGWTREQADHKPLVDVFRIINESTRLTVESPVDKVLRLGTIVGLANHTLLIRKDGSEVPIDDSGAPIRHPDGTIFGVVLVFRDFTAQKQSEAVVRQSEERLRLAVDAAELGTFYCTFPLNKIIWNDRCKAHFWLPPEAEVDFDLFYKMLHPDDRERTREAIELARRDHLPYDVEYRSVSQDGQTRWVRAIGRFYYDGQNQPTRFDGITMDITDRKRQESVLRQAQSQAEQANKSKDQFLAALSHELRTPLTPVLATLGLWERMPDLPESMRQEMQMLHRNIELEARLIDDLLDLTRVVKGKMVLSPQTVDVNEILGNVMAICDDDIRSKKIDLEAHLNAERRLVEADSARLQQVFWNIVRNAVKFSPRQGRVELATENLDGHIRVKITDHGIGMTAETIERLFRPFEQGNAEITRQFGGLGLGMAISKALIDAQGGSIRGESQGPNQGSTFTVSLPLADSRSTVADAAPQAEAVLAPTTPLNILLTEDHADTARILKLVVESWGHRVEVAETVAAGVELAKREKFDLLISDLGLPDGSGLDLIREVRKFSTTPAIALTGYGMDDDIAATRTAGFEAHLTKPTNLQDLQSLIAKLTQPKEQLSPDRN